MMRARRGGALLLVIVIVGLMSVLVVSSFRRAQMEAIAAENTLNATRAHALTLSGYAAAAVLLLADADEATPADNRTEFWYAGDDPGDIFPIPVGEHLVTIRIEDEYGKFPLGALVKDDGKQNADTIDAYARFIEALELEEVDEEQLVWALVDWIDDDSTDDQYEYNDDFDVPNRPLTHVDELARIEGYSELSADNLKKITDRVSERDGKWINVNTASAEVLYSMHPDLSLDDAYELYDLLGETPDEKDNVLVPLMPKADRYMDAVDNSNLYSVAISADVKGVQRKADCIIERSRKPPTVRLVWWSQY